MELADKEEDWWQKLKRGNIGGGLLNLAGATLNAPKSYVLNAVNAIFDIMHGKMPKLFYNMDFRDYASEVAKRSGTRSVFELSEELKQKGWAGSFAGSTIETRYEQNTEIHADAQCAPLHIVACRII